MKQSDFLKLNSMLLLNFSSKIICRILFISICLTGLYAEKTLKQPADPNYPSLDDSTQYADYFKNIKKYNIQFQTQKGAVYKGIVENLKGFYLTLSWNDNEISNQQILIDFVKSIQIKGYTMKKKTQNNLSIIYYLPYLYDIEMKDGQIIKDAKGLINELESFTSYNNIGKQKCFTYFVRYWLEDKRIFNDNKSKNYNETPRIPSTVITKIEFINEISE